MPTRGGRRLPRRPRRPQAEPRPRASRPQAARRARRRAPAASAREWSERKWVNVGHSRSEVGERWPLVPVRVAPPGRLVDSSPSQPTLARGGIQGPRENARVGSAYSRPHSRLACTPPRRRRRCRRPTPSHPSPTCASPGGAVWQPVMNTAPSARGSGLGSRAWG